MFDKFQQTILNILEDVAAAPSPATSNSTGGGTFGPNATQNTFNNSSIKGDMSIAGGVNPKKKKKKFFPIARRPLNRKSL
jgi:hypothetical protein